MTSGNPQIGLFFGSFNPVHIGHLIIANHMVEFANLHQVWLVVSPHNPLKPRQTLARDHDRLHLVQLATDDNPRLKASQVEFGLPRPSYTVDTLAYLTEKYPDHHFHLIMGSDNLVTLDKWKNFEVLLERYRLLVYRRPGVPPTRFDDHPNVQFVTAPLMEISSTFIRSSIRAGKSIRYLVPEPVFRYLDTSTLYRG